MRRSVYLVEETHMDAMKSVLLPDMWFGLARSVT